MGLSTNLIVQEGCILLSVQPDARCTPRGHQKDRRYATQRRGYGSARVTAALFPCPCCRAAAMIHAAPPTTVFVTGAGASAFTRFRPRRRRSHRRRLVLSSPNLDLASREVQASSRPLPSSAAKARSSLAVDGFASGITTRRAFMS